MKENIVLKGAKSIQSNDIQFGFRKIEFHVRKHKS